jgi:hypothetical protein
LRDADPPSRSDFISIAKKIATQSVDCHRVEAVEDAVADGKGQGQGLVTMAAPAFLPRWRTFAPQRPSVLP